MYWGVDESQIGPIVVSHALANDCFVMGKQNQMTDENQNNLLSFNKVIVNPSPHSEPLKR